MCTKPLLSVSQVCANDRGKADINLWIYLVMFKIVLYSTILSVSQVCANDRGKGDFNLWIYLIMFRIVFYSTIQLHCIVTQTILHYMDTVHSHFPTLQEVWLWFGKKSPVLQSQYWAFFANPCITGKIPYYRATNKSAAERTTGSRTRTGPWGREWEIWWPQDRTRHKC